MQFRLRSFLQGTMQKIPAWESDLHPSGNTFQFPHLYSHSPTVSPRASFSVFFFVVLNIAPQCNGVKNVSSSEWQLTDREEERDLIFLLSHDCFQRDKKEKERKRQNTQWSLSLAYITGLIFSFSPKTANICAISMPMACHVQMPK